MFALLRFLTAVRRLTDHTPRLLVIDGKVQRRQLLRSGVPVADLQAALREDGVRDLSEVRAAVFEATGALTVVRVGQHGDLVDAALAGDRENPRPERD